jgi:hypothetical protein
MLLSIIVAVFRIFEGHLLLADFFGWLGWLAFYLHMQSL